MNSRRIVLLVLLVVGLGTLYGAYQTVGRQSHVVAEPAMVAQGADDITVAVVAPAVEHTDAVVRTSDAPDAVAQSTIPSDAAAASSSITLPDALEGLDSTEYRIARMLCQDLY